MKKIIGGIILIAIVVLGFYFFNQSEVIEVVENTEPEVTDVVVEDEVVEEDLTKTVIGQSVLGNDITAYHYGSGETDILLIGGIHGGYSWNTGLVAYEMMEYLDTATIPENVKVTVIPVLNPDGYSKVVDTEGVFSESSVTASKEERIAARFNANDVDLNRNFDCEWAPESKWQNTTVSGGDSVFSEPESLALKSYVDTNSPDSVVVYYSSAGGVYASNCGNGVLSETTEIMNAYSDASGYPAYDSFDFYEITGDVVNWFAKNDVPAISILLTTHDDSEKSRNILGLKALLTYYAK